MIPGVPSALSPAEVRVLQQLARDRKVVEAGALLGYSTIKLAEVARSVVSIDKHCGYTGPTYRRYMSNLERAGVGGKVAAIVGDATSHLSAYAGDLAFIDLTCTYEVTRAAVLATRTPFVAIHDFERVSCGGVGRLVAELGWPVVERADTLIVLARPSEDR